MKTKLLFVKRRFLIVILFALMFACLIAGATTSVAYAAGEHTDHSGYKTLRVMSFNRSIDGGNYVLGSDFSFDGYLGFTDVIVLYINIIHDNTTGFTWVNPVCARNSLHKRVAFHRFVQI